jgi:hypothetical protein
MRGTDVDSRGAPGMVATSPSRAVSSDFSRMDAPILADRVCLHGRACGSCL